MAEQGDPLLPGPVFATGYHLSGDDLGVTSYGYARYANPTWTALETACDAASRTCARASIVASPSAISTFHSRSRLSSRNSRAERTSGSA